jgi:hypothetical protein
MIMDTDQVRLGTFCACIAAGMTPAEANIKAGEAAEFAQAEANRKKMESKAAVDEHDRRQAWLDRNVTRRAACMLEVTDDAWERRCRAYHGTQYVSLPSSYVPSMYTSNHAYLPDGYEDLEWLAFGAAIGTAWAMLTDEQRAAIDAGGSWPRQKFSQPSVIHVEASTASTETTVQPS